MDFLAIFTTSLQLQTYLFFFFYSLGLEQYCLLFSQKYPNLYTTKRNGFCEFRKFYAKIKSFPRSLIFAKIEPSLNPSYPSVDHLSFF